MYKDINDLLSERKTETERRAELFAILPVIENGEKVYYNEDSYIYYDGEDLYNGTDKYSRDNLVKGAFPYIFFLSYIYNAQMFAEEAKKYEAFNKDKKFKETSAGFITYPEIGVISKSSVIQEFLEEFKLKEKEDEEKVETAINEAILDAIVETA